MRARARDPQSRLASAAMRYRLLRSHHTVSLAPLCDVTPSVSPVACDLAGYTLKLEASVGKVGGDAGWGVLCEGRGCEVGRWHSISACT
jgi:hypothetical protein